MTRRAMVLALLAAGAACTEELTTPAVCPDFCPPGEIIVIDTLFADLVGGDSAFRGYVQPYQAAAMLAADLPGVVDSRRRSGRQPWPHGSASGLTRRRARWSAWIRCG